jgi:hypothetical protein
MLDMPCFHFPKTLIHLHNNIDYRLLSFHKDGIILIWQPKHYCTLHRSKDFIISNGIETDFYFWKSGYLILKTGFDIIFTIFVELFLSAFDSFIVFSMNIIIFSTEVDIVN